MTNDSKSANGCLPSTHPLAYSQKPLKARGQNKGIMGGRFVYLTLRKKNTRGAMKVIAVKANQVISLRPLFLV